VQKKKRDTIVTLLFSHAGGGMGGARTNRPPRSAVAEAEASDAGRPSVNRHSAGKKTRVREGPESIVRSEARRT